MRAVGIIIKDNQILLIHRIKTNKDYYVFPGGTIEEKETSEEALKREIKEETSLAVTNFEKILELENRGKQEVYFRIINFEGSLQLGGPEKEKMDENNRYLLEWHNISEIKELPLYPKEAVTTIIEYLKNSHQAV